jgi:hypothetical protein
MIGLVAGKCETQPIDEANGCAFHARLPYVIAYLLCAFVFAAIGLWLVISYLRRKENHWE